MVKQQEFVTALYVRAEELGLRKEKSSLQGHDFYNGNSESVLKIINQDDSIWMQITDTFDERVEGAMQEVMKKHGIVPAEAFLDELTSGNVFYKVNKKW